MLPKHPIYIVSKGRYETRLTSDSLDEMGVQHYVVVEEQERELYAERVAKTATILILDPRYQREYDTCDDLGDNKSKGPGAARNFAWEHSIANGAKWHWVMDDNIAGFVRLFKNKKIPAKTGSIFLAMEDFCERYVNIAVAGPHYREFIWQREDRGPFILNTRVYSCNLIRNDISYRWRGRYNEDTDLSLRVLKDGWCTVQFYAFLQNKAATQTLKGGCTDEFYAKEGTLPKSEMQMNLHPDVSRLTWKWGRWHHHVDYSVFKNNKLVFKNGVTIPDGINEYGMVLKEETEAA